MNCNARHLTSLRSGLSALVLATALSACAGSRAQDGAIGHIDAPAPSPMQLVCARGLQAERSASLDVAAVEQAMQAGADGVTTCTAFAQKLLLSHVRNLSDAAMDGAQLARTRKLYQAGYEAWGTPQLHEASRMLEAMISTQVGPVYAQE